MVSLAAGTLLVLARFFNDQRVPEFLRFPWQAQANDFALSFGAGKLALNADRIITLSAWLLFPILVIAFKIGYSSASLLQFDWASYFRILLLAGIYLVLKLLVASAIGYAFEREEALWKAQNISLAHFAWASIMGGALAFTTYFLPLGTYYFYLLSLPLIAVGLIFLFRVLIFCRQQGFSLSYIILYLCALEIIPLIYLYSLV